jgi:hypothetical protein
MFCYIHATARPHTPVTEHLDFLNQVLNDVFEIISLNFEHLRKDSPAFNFMGQGYSLAFLRRQVDYMLSL